MPDTDELRTGAGTRPYGRHTLRAMLEMALADAPLDVRLRFIDVNARHGRAPARRLALGWSNAHSGHRFPVQEMDDWIRVLSERQEKEYVPVPWEPETDPLLNLALDLPETFLREFALLTVQGALLTAEEERAAWGYVSCPEPPDEASADRARSLACLPIERLRAVLAAGAPQAIAALLAQP